MYVLAELDFSRLNGARVLLFGSKPGILVCVFWKLSDFCCTSVLFWPVLWEEQRGASARVTQAWSPEDCLSSASYSEQRSNQRTHRERHRPHTAAYKTTGAHSHTHIQRERELFYWPKKAAALWTEHYIHTLLLKAVYHITVHCINYAKMETLTGSQNITLSNKNCLKSENRIEYY